MFTKDRDGLRYSDFIFVSDNVSFFLLPFFLSFAYLVSLFTLGMKEKASFYAHGFVGK